MNKRIYWLLVAVVVLVLAATAVYSYGKKYNLIPGLQATKGLPSQDEWNASLATSTVRTLTGTVTAKAGRSLTLSLQQPSQVGSSSAVTVAIGSSTLITKYTPPTAAENAAAFKEFQKAQAAAGGKPFTPPAPPSDTAAASFAELAVGDSVLITLTPNSAENAFAAASIEILTLASAATAPMPVLPAPVPATPSPVTQ